MTYAIAKIQKETLETIASIAGDKMNSYPAGSMGLTPDSVKATDEWKSDFSAMNLAKKNLRTFNGWFVKAFKAEYAAERKARFA